jgi:hypothetical protein
MFFLAHQYLNRGGTKRGLPPTATAPSSVVFADGALRRISYLYLYKRKYHAASPCKCIRYPMFRLSSPSSRVHRKTSLAAGAKHEAFTGQCGSS